MQITCPHCSTIFKVSNEHLNAADGYLRCGVCKEVFNALEKKEEILKQLQEKNAQERKARELKAAELKALELKAAELKAEELKAEELKAQELKAEELKAEELKAEELRAEGLKAQELKAEELKAQAAVRKVKIAEAEAQIAKLKAEKEAASEAEDSEQTSLAAHFETDNFEHKSDSNLFDGVQSKLIPDEYRIPELHNTYTVGQDLVWSLAILLFTASLFVEYTWFNRNELIANPQLRPLIVQFCKAANCSTEDLREPGKIEMVTRNIYTHPNVKDALMVSGTLVNRAEFNQAYPNILVDFSDVRGEIIASRTFTPEDYLQIKSSSLKPLSPQLSVDFNLEIKDPGKQAMTYEFSFL